MHQVRGRHSANAFAADERHFSMRTVWCDREAFHDVTDEIVAAAGANEM